MPIAYQFIVFQARVIIDFVKEMGWQQIAILYQDDSYGQVRAPAAYASTHLPLDKMAAISQTIFSDAYSWMKKVVYFD